MPLKKKVYLNKGIHSWESMYTERVREREKKKENQQLWKYACTSVCIHGCMYNK